MKRLGWLSILMLALYVAVVFAADVHFHDEKDHSALHCQLCQISNISLIQAHAPHSSPGTIELGILTEFRTCFSPPDTAPASFGRAPPLS
jgi:hypothetical protein